MLQRNLNALIILILAGVLTGAFGVQFIWHEQPCPLCLLQRLGMLGVAVGASMNALNGIHPRNYGIMLISSIFGGFVALRQISLHVCPGFSEFGVPVLGFSLYTWSFFVFTCCVASVGLLLFLYQPKTFQDEPSSKSTFVNASFWIIFVLAIGNFVATLFQCGLGVCVE